MVKAAIVACVLCAGAGGTAMWVTAGVQVKPGGATVVMPSMLELHNNAHLENLPVREVKELY
jgi:hypothetical protein